MSVVGCLASLAPRVRRKVRNMWRTLAALLLLSGPAWAQQEFPVPLSQVAVDQQVSADSVSNFVFTSPNSQRRTLFSLSVKSGASAGFVLLIDGASLPSNGALTPCASSATARPCRMWCMPLAANSGMAVQWEAPLRFTTGVVAAFSTTGCDTLTASATAAFAGQAP